MNDGTISLIIISYVMTKGRLLLLTLEIIDLYFHSPQIFHARE